MVATKRKQYVNLQTKWLNGKRWKICTKCLKTKTKKLKV